MRRRIDVRTISKTGNNRAGLSETKTAVKYKNELGRSINEVFAHFFMRIYKEIPKCKICTFATLKILSSSNFAPFRQIFLAKLKKIFIVPAKTFDNVTGLFPIGFFIYDTADYEIFKEIEADVINADGAFLFTKKYFPITKGSVISDWIRQYYDQKGNSIGFLTMNATDFQHSQYINISSEISKHDLEKHMYAVVTQKNLISICIFYTIRHCIEHTWINNNDQFLFPNEGWKNDIEFQTNCLIFTLFHDKNRISCKQGVNHWIPFSENEVEARGLFDSHFMKDFLDGKIKPTPKNDGGLFAIDTAVETRHASSLQFGETAKSVLKRGLDLWKYYHTMEEANPNASLYDIKEFFQGRNDKGKMNATSDDPIYTSLLNELKTALRALGEEIKPKVYEYGFLR